MVCWRLEEDGKSFAQCSLGHVLKWLPEWENYYLRGSNGCKLHANACAFELEAMGKEPISCEVNVDVAAGTRYNV
jgi:hypothetical protein